MQPYPERRKYHRISTAEFIRFSFPLSYECFLAELINVSSGGLCMRSDFRTEIGLWLFIKPAAAGSYGFCSQIDTGCPAQVRWCKAVRRRYRQFYTIGVAFQAGGENPACRLYV